MIKVSYVILLISNINKYTSNENCHAIVTWTRSLRLTHYFIPAVTHP